MAADVVVALPGGIGTLSEAAMVWAAAQTETEAAKLVLVGDAWGGVRAPSERGSSSTTDDLALARCVDTVDEVVVLARAALAEPQRRGSARG